MIKKLITTSCICLSAFMCTYGQMAKQKNISPEVLFDHINELMKKGDEASKIEILKEAEVMANSNNEVLVLNAQNIFEILNEQQKADALNKTIAKKFPNGIKARLSSFYLMFEDAEQSARSAEEKYDKWLKRFPPEKFVKQYQGLYDEAATKLAILYFKENNQNEAIQYIGQLRSSKDFPVHANVIAKKLYEDGQYEDAYRIVEEAYPLMEGMLQSSNPNIDNYDAQEVYKSLSLILGNTLLKQGQFDKSIKVLENFNNTSTYERSAPEIISSLADGYSQKGKNLQALLALSDFISQYGRYQSFNDKIKNLYVKLNGSSDGLEKYLSVIQSQGTASNIEKHKTKMLNIPAPEFTLNDRQGKSVSLSDYRGKVVVLDFWATWCGPCVMSFPGMQASVDNYANDPEVAFLFINTMQQEANYKEKVDELLSKNNYRFHVVFDEMNDTSKSVAKAFRVDAIPHKVVIDKAGIIRFESSGSSSDVDKIVNELETKIELVKQQ